MVRKTLLLISLLAGVSYGDTGYKNTIKVTETDNSPVCTAGQLKFQPGQVTCNGQTATLNITGGGGGGSSSLAVTVGVNRSSPTSDVMFNPAQFSGSISGSTITISSIGSGGGIVSPGTFTWVNQNGISLSTAVITGTLSASSTTIDNQLIVNSTYKAPFMNQTVPSIILNAVRNNGAISIKDSDSDLSISTNPPVGIWKQDGRMYFGKRGSTGGYGNGDGFYINYTNLDGNSRYVSQAYYNSIQNSMVIGDSNEHPDSTLGILAGTSGPRYSLSITSNSYSSQIYQLVVTTSGYVGINQSTPTANLDVNGLVKISTLGTGLGVCTDGSSQLTTSGCSFGGSGGSSSLAVTVGVNRSSPTSDVMFNPAQFSGSISGSTITISLSGSTGGDNLGNHIATMTVTAGYGINASTGVFSSSITVVGNYQKNNSRILDSIADSSNTLVGFVGTPTTGVRNTLAGYGSGTLIAGQNDVTAFGYRAAHGSDGLDGPGAQNTAIGSQAGEVLRNGGVSNTFVGYKAGVGNITGDDNVLIGSQAGWNVGGSRNINIGSLTNTISGSNNDTVLVGNGISMQGSGSICIGSASCSTTDDVYNSVIGYSAKTVSGASRAVAIGVNATAPASNTAKIGGEGTDSLMVLMSSMTVSSATVTGLTIRGLTSQNCIGTDANGVTQAGTCGGGGGGSSSLAVGTGTTSGYTGTIVSSPTSLVLFDNATMAASLQGGATAFVGLLSSSVTLQGNSISISALQTQANAIGVSTQTLATAVGLSTASLRTDIVAIGVTTASLRTDMTSVGVATASLRTDIVAIGVTTGTLRTDVTAIGVTTASLRTDITAIGVTTASLRTSITAVGVDTGTLRTDVNGKMASFTWPTCSGTDKLTSAGATPTCATDQTGSGGGGASTLAVTTGAVSGFSSVASSPTAVIVFDSSTFNVNLKGGATAFVSLNTSPQLWTSAGTGAQEWDKPVGAKIIEVLICGGGGSGGGGSGAAAGAVRSGGGGGGGAFCAHNTFLASTFGSSVTVTIGGGGASRAGGTAGAGTDGQVGTSSTFEVWLTGYGGGGGSSNAAGAGGGGGGGGMAVGASATSTAGTAGGACGAAGAGANTGSATCAGAGGGTATTSAASGGVSYYSGAGGGAATTTGVAGLSLGGSSVFSAAGGGCGGGVNAASPGTAQNGASGGATGGGVTAAGGGGTGGAGNGGNGADGYSTKAGQGGAGGASSNSTTGFTGGTGGIPGGGGGGGGAGTNVGGASGAGGDGKAWVWTYF